MKKGFKLTWRDGFYLFGGIVIGLVCMYFYFSHTLTMMLEHIRIEQVVIGFNETKMVELAYELAKQI